MKLLFLEIWLYLLLAFLLGMFVQWFFCCRGTKSQRSPSDEIIEAEAPQTAVKEEQVSDTFAEAIATKPMGLESPPDKIDQLKRIKGVGPVIEQTLNGLGIYTFEQIASWNEENIAWIEEHLSFPGRIQREQWVPQAQTLNTGGETAFSQRVDRGEAGYD